MKVYLPWTGEFGSELLKWATRIKADKDPKIVCYERGKSCLYPVANVFTHTILRIDELNRKCGSSLNQQEIWQKIINFYGSNHIYVKPDSKWWSTRYEENEPFEPIPISKYNIECDIAVFPRWRHNTARKNWESWPKFVSLLKAHGFNVFACGHPDSSYDVGSPCAGDFDNPLEASIYAIKNSKIRIGCNTALNILSLYCGKRIWMIVNENGMNCHKGKDSPNYSYYWFADHKKVGWRIFPFYHQFDRIIPYIEEVL